MRLAGNNCVICNHRWPVKVLLAAFVGALKLVTGSVRVEKAHTAQPKKKLVSLHLINLSTKRLNPGSEEHNDINKNRIVCIIVEFLTISMG